MKYFITLFSLTLLILSCGKKPAPVLTPKTLSLVIGNPVAYGYKDLLLFPIGANYNPEINKGEERDNEERLLSNSNKQDQKNGFKENRVNLYDRSASLEYVNQNEQDFDIRNILFYDKVLGSSFILSNDTLHILSFAVHNEFVNPLIFYRVVKRDINKDSKYNSADAVMLYVSRTDGKDFIQVTPEDEQFFDYFYYPETASILIKTAFDIDKDLKFTELDETNFREMRIAKPAFGKEIFTKSMKDSLKAQISILK